jgi:recombination protein RecR
VNPIERLTQAFERFPGIGPRQARRFVQFLLTQPGAFRAALAQDLGKLGTNTFQCSECFRWSVKNGDTTGICNNCGNSKRDKGILFVVEKDADIDTVEKSGYRGVYFVLGGTVPLAAEEPEKHIRVRELVARVERDGGELVLNELILGLSATTEGDHTRQLLAEKLRPMSQGLNFKISSLGRGLSTGSELEYADPGTIADALSSRQ